MLVFIQYFVLRTEVSTLSNIICSCFGHRNVYQNIDAQLSAVLEDLIVNKGVDVFWTGGMGEFDGKFAGTVRGLKLKYPHISLILIKPYFSGELNTNKYYYETCYDDVCIPDALMGVHPKSAITKRNHWMVDNSNYIVTFVYRDFGGAYDAKKYAIKQSKTVIELSQK